MTQEELDALMNGDISDDDLEEDSSDNDQNKEEKESDSEDLKADEYKLEGDVKAWPPPPPTEDHKVVDQLDDVTRDSEVKATEIFDKLETISDFVMQAEEGANDILATLNKNVEIFQKLVDKFPNVEIFKERFEDNKSAVEKIEDIISNAQMSSDEVMMIMDIMQYQDIHRQKIERVINVIRTLASYMNSLFSANKDDTKRVSSAVHIAGDTSTEDVVSNDDIEALIEQLGKK